MEFGNLRSYIRLTFIEYVTDVLPVPTAHLPVCQDTVTAKYSSDLNYVGAISDPVVRENTIARGTEESATLA